MGNSATIRQKQAEGFSNAGKGGNKRKVRRKDWGRQDTKGWKRVGKQRVASSQWIETYYAGRKYVARRMGKRRSSAIVEHGRPERDEEETERRLLNNAVRWAREASTENHDGYRPKGFFNADDKRRRGWGRCAIGRRRKKGRGCRGHAGQNYAGTISIVVWGTLFSKSFHKMRKKLRLSASSGLGKQVTSAGRS